MATDAAALVAALPELRGKVLGCPGNCAPGPCHADVLLQMANSTVQNKIDSFSGENRFLSNFWQTAIVYEGQEYPSTEHAYQAAKSLDLTVRRAVAATPTAAEAKALGRRIAMRTDWEQVKLQVMEDVLRQKFANPDLHEKLIATENSELTEGNTWGDRFWGVCNGVGENHLGKLLMKIRDDLQETIVEDEVVREQNGFSSPLKWAGGKRTLIPRLLQLYTPHRHRRLVEPFVGGMNVALGLQPDRALLCDANPHLINFYERLRDEYPFTLKMENSEHLYYAYRKCFNELIAGPMRYTQTAAELFYYLNRTCFNGLCRFNRSGEFNVPYGKYKTINYTRDFSRYEELLRKWELKCCRFDDVQFASDDFLYADPPYDGTFTDYSAGGFSWEDQERLALKLAAHVGPVVASNACTERIVGMYEELGFKTETIEMRRSIAANGDRKPAAEMLATKNI
jgi:DNA adenine methylase